MGLYRATLHWLSGRRRWVVLGGLLLAGGPGVAQTAKELNARAEQLQQLAPEQSLQLAQQAERVARQTQQVAVQAQALNSMGSGYFLLENYEQALRCYLRALTLDEKLGNLKGVSSCYNNIGNVYLAREQYSQALEFYRRSLQLDRQRGDSLGLADSYVNIANACSSIHTPEAQRLILPYFNRALQMYRRVHQLGKEAMTLHDIANLYFDQQRYPLAQQYFERSLALSQQVNTPREQAQTLQSLGDVHSRQRHWQQAIDYYQRSAVVGAAFSDVMRNYYLSLAETFAQAGDYRRAYDDYLRYTALKDSAFDRETTDRINELQTRFQTQQKEKQIQDQQQALTRKNQLISLSLGSTTLVLLLAGGLLWQYRQKNRSNQLLLAAHAEVNQSVVEKEVLIQEIHHRVKNNLQLVSSLLSWQSSVLPDPALVQVIAESQARIHSIALVHEYLYRADNLAQVSMDAYLGGLLDSLRQSYDSPQQRVELRTELAPLQLTAKDAVPFGLLVNELITNAYKHAFRGRASGCLLVSLELLGEGFRLRVQDDGVGLPPADEAASAAAARPSLGLQLARMLARQLRATLSMRPMLPSGTCFEVLREG